MNCRKFFAFAIFAVVILNLRLCVTSEIETKFNHSNGAVEENHPTEFQIDNATDPDEKDISELATSTAIPLSDIKVVDQKYSQNTSGEYKHEVLFSNGNWRAEHGEYEDHNGQTVFVIRGVFSYYTREGTYNTTLYIVDEFGYHNVEPPPQITQDGSGMVDYRPDVETTSDCSNGKGNSYCIDPKLLALLVG